MTEQQYHVLADAAESAAEESLHKLWGTDDQAIVQNAVDALREAADRIERPVPTTDEQPRTGVSTDGLRGMADLLDGLLNRATLRQAADELDRLRSLHPSVPTREQIAEAVHRGLADRGFDFEDEDTAHLTDAVLALIDSRTS